MIFNPLFSSIWRTSLVFWKEWNSIIYIILFSFFSPAPGEVFTREGEASGQKHKVAEAAQAEGSEGPVRGNTRFDKRALQAALFA